MSRKVLKDMVMATLIKKESSEKKSEGGIIIPDSVEMDDNETGLRVTVTQVGKDVEEIEVGDTVLIQAYGNNEVSIDGEKFIIFRESVAICVL